MGPRGAMLLRKVVIGLRYLLGQEQSILIFAFGLSQSLEILGPQHLAQRIGRIDRAIDADEAYGEYIGVARFSAAGGASLRAHYDACAAAAVRAQPPPSQPAQRPPLGQRT